MIVQPLRLALAQLRMWRAAWRAYETEIPKLDGAATPYRSRSTSSSPEGEPDAGGAMAETAEAAREELSRSLRAVR